MPTPAGMVINICYPLSDTACCLLRKLGCWQSGYIRRYEMTFDAFYRVGANRHFV